MERRLKNLKERRAKLALVRDSIITYIDEAPLDLGKVELEVTDASSTIIQLVKDLDNEIEDLEFYCENTGDCREFGFMIYLLLSENSECEARSDKGDQEYEHVDRLVGEWNSPTYSSHRKNLVIRAVNCLLKSFKIKHRWADEGEVSHKV